MTAKVITEAAVTEVKYSIFSSRYRRQIFAAIAVQLMTLAHGIAVGWLSPALQSFQTPETPLSFAVTVTETSWIGSLLGLGSVVGNITFGVLLDRIGRKKCLQLLALPYAGLWILIYFAQRVEFLYIARFLGGMTGGGNYVVMPIFISEIADTSIRGSLSSMAMLILSFGILFGSILSSHVPYHIIPMIIIPLPFLYLLIVWFLPETPQFLIKRKCFREARSSFNFYKNIQQTEASQGDDSLASTATSCTELPSLSASINGSTMDVTVTIRNTEKHDEFKQLEANILNAGADTKITAKDFIKRESLQAFLTAFVLMAMNQFSGSFALFNYTSDIFAASGTTMDPNTCTIIVGVTQIFGTLGAVLLVERCGRKTLLMLSAGGMAMGLLAFGLFVQFATQQARASYNWLPLLLMIFIVFIQSLGVVALIFVIVVEIMPMKIRPLATSFCMVAMSSMVFIALKVYPLLLFDFGIAVTMFICAGIAFVCMIYLFLRLPETKGKSMES